MICDVGLKTTLKAQIMGRAERRKTTAIPTDMIAPCGMNCRLCWGFIRERNTCPGCLRSDNHDSQKSKCRTTCRIRNCEHLAQTGKKYCSDRCPRFPCTRLRQLDNRYRTKYGMSMIDNLQMIDNFGTRHFIRTQKEQWECPECGQLLCVHRPECCFCGHEWQ
jgi:hypothetical protein